MKVKILTWNGKPNDTLMHIIKSKAIAECNEYDDMGAAIMTPEVFASAADQMTADCKLFVANCKKGTSFMSS